MHNKIKKILITLLFVNLIAGQTTLIDPAIYARKYEIEDPYKNLNANIPQSITIKKEVKTSPGKPKVIKNYPNSITRQLNLYKKSVPTTKIYYVQVYSHSDKNKVLEMKSRAKIAYPQYDFIIVFERPFFKLRAYPFYSREEANKAKLELKKGFPGAFIVVPK